LLQQQSCRQDAKDNPSTIFSVLLVFQGLKKSFRVRRSGEDQLLQTRGISAADDKRIQQGEVGVVLGVGYFLAMEKEDSALAALQERQLRILVNTKTVFSSASPQRRFPVCNAEFTTWKLVERVPRWTHFVCFSSESSKCGYSVNDSFFSGQTIGESKFPHS
jgi:hypothetical protein